MGRKIEFSASATGSECRWRAFFNMGSYGTTRFEAL